MANLISMLLLILLPVSSWAAPKLTLLKDAEWKGTCRKVTNEANQEVKKQRPKF